MDFFTSFSEFLIIWLFESKKDIFFDPQDGFPDFQDSVQTLFQQAKAKSEELAALSSQVTSTTSYYFITASVG